MYATFVSAHTHLNILIFHDDDDDDGDGDISDYSLHSYHTTMRHVIIGTFFSTRGIINTLPTSAAIIINNNNISCYSTTAAKLQ